MAGIGRAEYEGEVWYRDVADLQIREGLSFSAACQALGIKFATSSEERKHERRKAYQRLYWALRNAYMDEVGSDPSLTKEVIMGVLARTVVKLEESGNFDKIASAAKTLSDIAGWTREGTEVTIVGGMSHQELEALKAKARALAQLAKVNPPKDGKIN
jgi:hypothetical protein